MSRNVIETVMGAVVLVIAGSFLVTAYEGRNINKVNDGYHVKAEFEDATGISVGSDVRMGGVKIGVVDSMELDTKLYQAQVGMTIRSAIPLPIDSTAAIVGDGLLGSKFISLAPGAEEDMLKEGGIIEYTQSSVSLEELIGKFVFSGGGVEGEEEEGAAESEAPEPAGATSAPATSEEDELKMNF